MEHQHTPDLHTLTDEARTYAVRIVGAFMSPEDDCFNLYRDNPDVMAQENQKCIWIAPSSESPFSQEKMEAAQALSEEVLSELTWVCMEAKELFASILEDLNRLAYESHGTVAWPVLDSDMNDAWECIGRLQACGVDTRPLAGIAQCFDVWVRSERENPARRMPAPPPTFAERVRGSVARMWGMGR
jgi:hypothetical protein